LVLVQSSAGDAQHSAEAYRDDPRLNPPLESPPPLRQPSHQHERPFSSGSTQELLKMTHAVLQPSTPPPSSANAAHSFASPPQTEKPESPHLPDGLRLRTKVLPTTLRTPEPTPPLEESHTPPGAPPVQQARRDELFPVLVPPILSPSPPPKSLRANTHSNGSSAGADEGANGAEYASLLASQASVDAETVGEGERGRQRDRKREDCGGALTLPKGGEVGSGSTSISPRAAGVLPGQTSLWIGQLFRGAAVAGRSADEAAKARLSCEHAHTPPPAAQQQHTPSPAACGNGMQEVVLVRQSRCLCVRVV
jgi:hypothetical protein